MFSFITVVMISIHSNKTPKRLRMRVYSTKLFQDSGMKRNMKNEEIGIFKTFRNFPHYPCVFLALQSQSEGLRWQLWRLANSSNPSYYLYPYVCRIYVWEHTRHICESPWRPEDDVRCLELNPQAVVNCQTWVLGSPGRVACPISHNAISPALPSQSWSSQSKTFDC